MNSSLSSIDTDSEAELIQKNEVLAEELKMLKSTPNPTRENYKSQAILTRAMHRHRQLIHALHHPTH